MNGIVPVYFADAFTDLPFRGNPAAVCFLSKPHSSEWMQKIAFEMNQSETAFFSIEKKWVHLRWFSPAMEVDLCGHATLATAHILWEKEFVPESAAIRFKTKSGILVCRKKAGWIEMDFPAAPATECPPPNGIEEALGTSIVYSGKNRMDLLIQLNDQAAVLKIKPDMQLLSRITQRGVIVTAKSNRKQYDFVSRFFAPSAGIPEDPVTGSAHCCLAPFWAQRLGKTNLTGYQASERGGIVKMEWKNDRVLLVGKAVTVMQGTLRTEVVSP